LLVERLYGPIHYRILLHLGPYSRSSIRALITDTLGGCGLMAHIDSGSAIVLVVEILLVLARRHTLCYNVFRR